MRQNWINYLSYRYLAWLSIHKWSSLSRWILPHISRKCKCKPDYLLCASCLWELSQISYFDWIMEKKWLVTSTKKENLASRASFTWKTLLLLIWKIGIKFSEKINLHQCRSGFAFCAKRWDTQSKSYNE